MPHVSLSGTSRGSGDVGVENALRFVLEHVERLEIAIQKFAGIGMPQPAGDHRRVDAPEIGGVEQVIAFVEFREAGDLAVVAALHFVAADSRTDDRSGNCADRRITLGVSYWFRCRRRLIYDP